MSGAKQNTFHAGAVNSSTYLVSRLASEINKRGYGVEAEPSAVFTSAAVSEATVQKSSSTAQLQKPDCFKKMCQLPKYSTY